jgi:hypothetical protein
MSAQSPVAFHCHAGDILEQTGSHVFTKAQIEADYLAGRFRVLELSLHSGNFGRSEVVAKTQAFCLAKGSIQSLDRTVEVRCDLLGFAQLVEVGVDEGFHLFDVDSHGGVLLRSVVGDWLWERMMVEPGAGFRNLSNASEIGSRMRPGGRSVHLGNDQLRNKEHGTEDAKRNVSAA